MKKLMAVVAVLLVAVSLGLWWFRPVDRQDGDAPPSTASPTADVVERGRELVTLGDCKGCHTTRGGAPFAGGRPIPTPFGTFFSPNITPDPETGLGRWSGSDFWRALHNGLARNGTPLYPTFPYTNYTKISRRDADAMYAYLRTVPPVSKPSAAHALRFPYDQRLLLVAWRYLFFRPGVYEVDPAQSAEWNRGAYLVQGLSHCSACHEARNALGAVRSKENPSGGLVLDWYAPSLSSSREAGVHDWTNGQIVTLLKTGQIGVGTSTSRHASTMGPMGEVVFDSLQYARDMELSAMAVYLKSLPDRGKPPNDGIFQVQFAASAATLAGGEKLYTQSCAPCHGKNGEGDPAAGPPLAGNRATTMASVVNPIRITLFGGYPPGTAGNPKPLGMPPFYPSLSDEQIADVLSYVRASWGNNAPPVSGDDVGRNRGSPLW